MLSTVRLFKALPIKTRQKKSPTEELLKKTIKRGFVFAPEVIANYSNYDELIGLVENVYGITGEKANASFHKSWVKIRDTDMEQLVVEQLAHYVTTYGKQSPEEYLKEKSKQWGIESLSEEVKGLEDFNESKLYDKDYIYIPKEKLEIPELEEGISLVIIKGYTKEELKEKLLNLLNSGIALKGETLKDVIDVALFVGMNDREIEGIKNKEARAILYSYLDLIPENPIEFLRYIIYQATNETLLIKSPKLIEKIKEENNIRIIKLFRDYDSRYGLKKLAEIFLRFKPLFLAFRNNRESKKIINKIRRLARTYHKPIPEDYLNEITTKIKKGEKINIERLESELSRVNIFRKIRLAYALNFRSKNANSILYRIRNGKSYATDFSFRNKEEAKKILAVVLSSISKDVSKNVKGKKIYIPEYVNYALPATEKQFTENFPSGSYVSVPQDMVVGVYWENVKRKRIDLDLSFISLKGNKIGWDGSYRTAVGDILFSGDITDAPEGATELFYVKRQVNTGLILLLNYYNYNKEISVPFKILVAEEKVEDFHENYMVNPNNIISVAQSEISQKQKILGLLLSNTKENRFYFTETSIGKLITSTPNKYIMDSLNYLIDFYCGAITLKDVLSQAGANFVEDKKMCDIDLSPESLEKDTILNMLQ